VHCSSHCARLAVGAASCLLLACCSKERESPVAKSADSSQAARQIAAWDKLTQGRIVERAESRYIAIENDTCPGERVVTSRFEQTDAGLVQLTEDNSQLQCTEGVRSRPLALVWRDGKYTAPPDTIHVIGESLHTVGGELVVGGESMADESEYYYYSIENSRALFSSQLPAVTFQANGVRRYLGVAGTSQGDTAAVVAYATGRTVLQRLAIPRDSTMRGAIVLVDSMRIDGPGRSCCNNVAVGGAKKDTLPVDGVALHFRLALSRLDGDDQEVPGGYVVRIVGDRMVLLPGRE